jgi:hypothetical protein
MKVQAAIGKSSGILGTIEHSDESNVKNLRILHLDFVVSSTVKFFVSGHGSFFSNVNILGSLSI